LISFQKRGQKYESPKFKVRSPPSRGEEESEGEIFFEEDAENDLIGLPRAQLELEYAAALQERELLLHTLADLLEKKMVQNLPRGAQ
jgi:hypothetical protein